MASELQLSTVSTKPGQAHILIFADDLLVVEGPKGRKPTAPVVEEREREEPKAQPAPEPESAPQSGVDGESLGEQFLRGAVLGDYGGEATVASVAGQVLVGFTPVGILADVRDFSAALKDLNEGKPGAGVGVVLAGIGFLPFGDIAKVLRKGDDLVEAGTDAARLADDVPSGPTISGGGPGGGGGGGASARGESAARGAPSAFGGLSRAGQFGVQPYSQLTKALKGTGLQAHHLLEQRFAGVLGQNARQMAAVAVTKTEHQGFTNAWRAAIPYGQGTANATRQQVLDAARQIYSGHPEILRALGL